MTLSNRLALYTTVYPGVERYLIDWYNSILLQLDKNFDLWIGVDQLEIDDINRIIGKPVTARWVVGENGHTPAQIRKSAIEQIVILYPGVIFVDSDDMLFPSRVSAAREALSKCDVIGCAMNIINQDGKDLHMKFEAPYPLIVDEILPTGNVFGFSNTAYRSDILCRCLNFPPNTVLVDWYISTQAWGQKAVLEFDNTPHMSYRQHPNNIAHIIPPFTEKQIIEATNKVMQHHELTLSDSSHFDPSKRSCIEAAQRYVKEFHVNVILDSELLVKYTHLINKLADRYIWWNYVANPALEHIWRN